MTQYRRLVSAMTAMHHRLEDCETLLDKVKRVVIAQARTIQALEEVLEDALGEGDEGDEGDEGEEGDEGDEYEEEEGDEFEEEEGNEGQTQASHEADFETGPAEPEDPEERARMDKISRGQNSGRSQAEIAAFMGGGGMPTGAVPDVPEGTAGPTGFERLIAQTQAAEANADKPAKETG